MNAYTWKPWIHALAAGCALLALAACQPIAGLVPAAATQAVPGAGTAEGAAVHYAGRMHIAGLTLDAVVTLTNGQGGYTGAVDIPAQGAQGIPLHDIRMDLPAIHFEMLAGPQLAKFDGRINADGTLTGQLTQGGYEGTFAFQLQEAAAPGPAQPAAAGPAAPAAPTLAVSAVYTDPDGRFSVPVPTNWSVDPHDGFAVLADPEQDIHVYALAVPSTNVEKSIADAWKQVDPTFVYSVKDVISPPSQAGVEKTVVTSYDLGQDKQRILQGYGQLKDGSAYILLFDAQLAGAQKRAAQLQIINSGLKIQGLPVTDLSKTHPLTITATITQPLEAFIESYRQKFGIPGAAVGIVQNGKLVYAKGFGTANPSTGALMTPQTSMMIGSTGKSLTTMLMGTLVDAAKMTWDTPVVDLFPSFKVKDPELTKQITMRNLVCACTGVPRRDMELLFNANGMSAADVVASLADFEFFTNFGEAFQYSNQMVATAGYVAGAAAEGSSDDLMAAYSKALQDRVLDPIGMHDTTLSLAQVQQRGNYAIPFTQNLDGAYAPLPLTVEKLLGPVAPAGAHWSTLEDMAKYMITELQRGMAPDGTRVVSTANLTETWKPQIAISADMSYGLGWMLSKYKGQPVISHGGNTLGFTSGFTFLPQENLGVIVLTNARASNLFNDGVATRLFELVYGQPPETQQQLDFYLQRLKQQVTQAKQHIADHVDPTAVEPYLGAFANPALGPITLALFDGVLTLDAGEFKMELRPKLDDKGQPVGYVAVDPPLQGMSFQLQMDEAGQPQIVMGEGAAEYRFTKTKQTE